MQAGRVLASRMSKSLISIADKSQFEVSVEVTVWLLGLILSLMHPAIAHADGDPDRGLAIATQWCNSCHVVQQSDPGMDDGEIGPRFSTLTKHTAQSLKELLSSGHADMDALSKLTANDVADIAAHLHRLQAEPSSR
jgi:mono/diheme cytochrome c family protein